jgi:hypothetical protein
MIIKTTFIHVLFNENFRHNTLLYNNKKEFVSIFFQFYEIKFLTSFFLNRSRSCVVINGRIVESKTDPKDDESH